MFIVHCRIIVLTLVFTFHSLLFSRFIKHLQTYVRSDISLPLVRRLKKISGLKGLFIGGVLAGFFV